MTKKRFSVRLKRTITFYADVEVVAKDEGEAEEIADKLDATKLEWGDVEDDDFEVDEGSTDEID